MLNYLDVISDGVVRFLEREAKEIGLLFKCFEVCGLVRNLSVHKLESMCFRMK